MRLHTDEQNGWGERLAGAPPEQMAQIVREPIQLAQAQPTPTPQPAAQPAAQTKQMLPRTTGMLPLVALAGLLSALGGIGLGLRRRLLAAKK